MMHQQAPSQQYNMPPSGGSGQHYQGQQNPMGMIGQGNHVIAQRPMPPYRPPHQGTLKSLDKTLIRSVLVVLMSFCVFLGPPQQYPGQEEYYTEQYSHGAQGAPEGKMICTSGGMIH